MLKQHNYYVYHDGSTVFARKEDFAPVVAKECASPQEAHDYVQSVINPAGKRPQDFRECKIDPKTGKPDPTKPLGFLSKEFQDAISPNCEKVVRAAYGE